MKNIKIFLLGAITLFSYNANAQSETEAPDISDRVITTAVPFLLISGDARASGLGDQGGGDTSRCIFATMESCKIRFCRKATRSGPFLCSLFKGVGGRYQFRSAFLLQSL